MQYLACLTREGRRTLIAFPDCPGCQTFAERSEDALAVAREALEGWLEVHLEDGEAPPHPSLRLRKARGSRVLGVRLDPALAVRLGIRWARQDAGLSQGELADRLGVSRQQVSLLESNGRNLTVGTLRRIAEALGRDVEIEFPVQETAA
jgi:predicted RNase H-like HicB family nuclease/DNA-binding XRE family transcriptional regulator